METLNQTNKQRKITIDIGRAIAAFLVVCLHTKFPIPKMGAFVSDLAKIAVPFFFILSGYYLYDENNENIILKIKKSLKKTFFILISAVIVYAILRYIKWSYFNFDISKQTFELVPFLLLNDCNYTEHLWYLFAYIDVLILLYLSYKFRLNIFLIYSLPILIIIHIIFSMWSRTITINPGWYELNWLVTGLPYVLIGFIIKINSKLVEKLSKKYLIYLICVLVCSIFLEHIAFKMIIGKGPGVISTFFLAISCFLYCAIQTSFNANKISQIIATFGLKHSLNIYIFHILVRDILIICNFNLIINNTIIIFILSFLLSILVNFITTKLSFKKSR
jgi:peptidoglycan/LPS O-acetylase OafA/YrhL